MNARLRRVAIIGGFSERAKNLLLANALRKISIEDPHSSVLVIRDHVEAMPGVGDVDKQTQVELEYLCGGCFCCTLKNDFEFLLKEYASKSGIWYFLVEAPLIADVDAIEVSIKHILGNNLKIEKAFTFDAEMINVLLEMFPDMFNRNIDQTDVLAISNSHDQDLTRLKRAPKQLKDCQIWHNVKSTESMGMDMTLFVREGKRMGFFFD